MRLIQDTAGWRPLDSAPVDRDVTLLVIDGASEPYQLKLPSGRLGEFGERIALGGDAGEVEAVHCSATSSEKEGEIL